MSTILYLFGLFTIRQEIKGFCIVSFYDTILYKCFLFTKSYIMMPDKYTKKRGTVLIFLDLLAGFLFVTTSDPDPKLTEL